MQQDPLSKLRDIHLPDPGGFWPPAPGWWLLFVLVTLTGLWLARHLWLRYRRNRWLQPVRRELQALAASQLPDEVWSSTLNSLIKRAARYRYPTRHPETLTGTDWARFLCSTGAPDTASSLEHWCRLTEATWRPDVHPDRSACLVIARHWLEAQRC